MIPYGRQDIREEDIEAVVDVLRSDFLTQGPEVPLFEKSLCDYTGADFSVVANSCTSALHLACLALGLGPGDMLWTSPITFVASANCALYCGASVDFVDIEPDTALMSVEKLKEKLIRAKKQGKLPKIVVPVHFSGQPCDMREIHALSQEYGFKVIEDAAHAIGANYMGEPVGNCRYSDITVFSFHPVKLITTGEGGAAVTNHPELARNMSLLRSHGITRDPEEMFRKSDGPWYYEQIALGFNYRMTDFQARLGRAQLERLDAYVSERKDIAEFYDEQFESIGVRSLSRKAGRTSAFHLYIIQISHERLSNGEVHQHLRKRGVGVNLHYIPIYKQPYYKALGLIGSEGHRDLENAEYYYERAVSLPIFPGLERDQLYKVVKAVSDVFEL